MQDIDSLLKVIEAQLTEKEMSPAIASRLAVGNPYLIYNFRKKGFDPKYKTLKKLCEALDLEFYIGPRRNERFRFDGFDSHMDVPTRGYAKCSLVGHLEGEQQFRDLAAPTGIRDVDEASFYVIAKGSSMVPEGINGGDYCLVSPNTTIKIGDRVWLKDRQNKIVIKRLTGKTDKTRELRSWLPSESGSPQQSYSEQWMKQNIAEQGVVLAVWRAPPDVNNPPKLIPDPSATRGATGSVAPSVADPSPVPAQVATAVKEQPGTVGNLDPDTFRDELVKVIETQTGEIARKVSSLVDARLRTDPSAGNDNTPTGARPVDVIELDSAAGGGAEIESETPIGRIWFRRTWFDEHGLDPTQCVVIGVMGDSMQPLLWPGSKIMVDRGRTEWRNGDIFVFRTGDGLIVKRAGEDRDGNRLLISENADWPPVPLSPDAEIIGRVVWTSRTLVKG